MWPLVVTSEELCITDLVLWVVKADHLLRQSYVGVQIQPQFSMCCLTVSPQKSQNFVQVR
jgi:hypothetical protein